MSTETSVDQKSEAMLWINFILLGEKELVPKEEELFISRKDDSQKVSGYSMLSSKALSSQLSLWLLKDLGNGQTLLADEGERAYLRRLSSALPFLTFSSRG